MARAILVSMLMLALPAQALAEPVEFNLVTKVLTTQKERPAFLVSANEPIDDFELVLTRDDGKVFEHRTGKMKARTQRSFPLVVVPGRATHFKAAVALVMGDQRSPTELEFDAEVVEPARIEYLRADLAARTIELKSSRPTSKVEVEVISDEGQLLGRTEVAFDDAPPGTPLPIKWEQREGTVLKLAFKVHEPGFFYGLELFPWRVDVPHEEVTFATNGSTIEKAEQPKLDKSFELIAQTVKRSGRWAELKLYVAGHTDTVGSPAANRALSLERARSISAYFRRKGLRVPILVEGFGEEALKVATPDETDEPQNRRVDYVIAVEPPQIGQGHWKPLR
jgi:outer membrane protein OmpA-like peptidoglycan-associated protein